ncbi:MAG: DNA-processing protein DprA [Candidatus Nanopelagicales bacterium]|nr:DNA-processing protein DprA [Candidatus Nanopelagicales bacterium]
MRLTGAERVQAIALACLVEPGTPGIAELVAEHGQQEAFARLRGQRRATRVVGRLDPDEVPAMLARMERLGVRIALPGDPEFPSQLNDLPEPPLALWIRGPLDLRAAALRSVAVVGARACTAYGERATAEVAGGLAGEGWAVISGAAFGIDAAAHRAALGVGGPTVAVLACGVDVAYPRAHDSLLCRIADAGLVVSELPPGSQPLKHRFLARNRVIAALSRGTVVVEAARRSGAVATASRALELGRVVMAVPGPITSMASSGSNRLLHEQVARAVSDSTEVTALLRGPGQEADRSDGSDRGGAVEAQLSGLPDGARRVLEELPVRGGRSVEATAERAGISPAASLAHLGLLEIVGLARRTGAGWRRCG